MTQKNVSEVNPTVEQSLHSIALSLIEINKVIQGAKRTQTRAFRLSKQESARAARPRPEPRRNPGPFDWIKRLFDGQSTAGQGGF